MDAQQQYIQAKKALTEAKARISYAQTIAHRDFFQSLSELDKWINQYEIAIKNNNQDLISKAKFQVERYEAIARRLAKLCDEQMPYLENIKERFKVWEEEIQQVSNKNKFITQETTIINTYQSNNSIDEELQKLKESISKKELEIQPVEDIPLESNIDLINFIDESIKNTQNVINSADIKIQDLQNNIQKANDKANKLYFDSLDALKNNQDELAIQNIVQRHVRKEMIDVAKSSIKRQKEMIDALNENVMMLIQVKKSLISSHADK